MARSVGTPPGLLYIAILGSFLVAVTVGERLPSHSWEPPFSSFDANGDRSVSKQWKTSGHAVVNQNFVRLTPDRQSKRGAIWSKMSVGVESLSTVLKFRISGQGEKFFGDGLALWFVQQGYYVEGDLHGSVVGFTGVGVIFDTFKNTERGAQHRDVTIVVNDGTKSQEVMLANIEGCDARGGLRYHERRADFSVESSSRARVVFTGGSLSVEIDETNDGAWTSCATVSVPFDEAWLRTAHIGITAATGGVADNHDVLSIVTYSDATLHAEDDAALVLAPRFERGSDGVDDARFERIEDTINSLLARFEYVGHHLEHEMESVEDHMKATVGKLQNQEKDAELRIEELETQVISNVEVSLEQRIASLEGEMERNIVDHASDVEKTLNAKISESVEVAVDSLGNGWKYPFFLLVIIDGVVGYVVYSWYFKFKKSHLL